MHDAIDIPQATAYGVRVPDVPGYALGHLRCKPGLSGGVDLRIEDVEDANAMPLLVQVAHEMRSDEPRSPRDEHVSTHASLFPIQSR
jgi:hypothetical protein